VTTQTIRIGSRGSQLALWQANHVAAQLRALGHEVEIEIIRTVGDRMQDPAFISPATFEDGTPLDAKGIFIKEIEDALAAGRIDLAVHSLKDLPTQLDPRFTLAAIPPRADARDAFVCEDYWGLHMLPMGSTVATTSPRRQAMLLALRPDLRFVEMRGNIDTRLRKWSEGQADALVLASAGLDRLGRTENVHQRFAIDELTPAPGQGALGLETRCPNFKANSVILSKGAGLHPAPQSKDPEGASSTTTTGPFSTTGSLDSTRDATIHAAIRTLNDPTTEYATQAERAVLAALGGGCQLPLGAYCHQVDDHWHLHAMVVSPDGETVAQVLQKAPLGTPASELGAVVAAELTDRGALELLREEQLTSIGTRE
jgi:hydroxymethylbilane synthase